MQGQPLPGGAEGELLLRVHPNVCDLSGIGGGAVRAFGYRSFALEGEREVDAEANVDGQEEADLTLEEFERIQRSLNAPPGDVDLDE